MNIFVSGSMAFDRIMNYPDKFEDHIIPEKIHILNVSLVVNGLEERFGGTAGNIAYTLALLGESPLILSTVGKDFDRYGQHLSSLGLPLHGIRAIDNEFTGGAYITTDRANNQFTAFNPGAMNYSAQYDFSSATPKKSWAVVAPGNVDDMVGFSATYRQLEIPYIFDPGQQIPALTGDQMKDALTGSQILITNDYELEMIIKATGLTRAEIMERTGTLITTLGEKGSVVADAAGEVRVGIAAVSDVKDPTGAGDAFRAGLLKGISMGKDLPKAASYGATCSAFCVECHGTQGHTFTQDEFWTRHKKNFG